MQTGKAEMRKAEAGQAVADAGCAWGARLTGLAWATWEPEGEDWKVDEDGYEAHEEAADCADGERKPE